VADLVAEVVAEYQMSLYSLYNQIQIIQFQLVMVLLVVVHLQVVLLVIDFMIQLDQVGMVEVQEEENRERLDQMAVQVVMEIVEELQRLHSPILQKEVLEVVVLEDLVVMEEPEVVLRLLMPTVLQFLLR
jgi:hypothetical protein